jgi:energy-coupling factor transporter transmembrane protein EcfT
VLNGWAIPGEAVLAVADRTIATREGLTAGAFFSIRLVALYLAMYLVVKSTNPEELAAAVHASLRRVSPTAARRVAFYGFVSMSFVPLFVDEFHRVRIAQSFRGGSLTGSLSARVQATRLLIVPLILSAVHRSTQLAMVTELRGLRDRLDSVLVVRAPRLRDAVVPMATLAVLAAAAVWLQ